MSPDGGPPLARETTARGYAATDCLPSSVIRSCSRLGLGRSPQPGRRASSALAGQLETSLSPKIVTDIPLIDGPCEVPS